MRWCGAGTVVEAGAGVDSGGGGGVCGGDLPWLAPMMSTNCTVISSMVAAISSDSVATVGSGSTMLMSVKIYRGGRPSERVGAWEEHAGAVSRHDTQ
jgi:hypothetical protein